MPKDEIIKAIKIAEEFEKARHELYKSLSNAIVNPEGKESLKLLAEAKKENLELLKKEQELLESGGKLDSNSLKKEVVMDFEHILERKKHEEGFRENVISLGDDFHILSLASEMEEKDIVFYEDLAKAVDDEDAKKLLLKIAEQAKRHIKILKAKIEDIQKMNYDMASHFGSRHYFFRASKHKKKEE